MPSPDRPACPLLTLSFPPPQLATGDLAPYHALLKLFAYGTWPDYRGEREGGRVWGVERRFVGGCGQTQGSRLCKHFTPPPSSPPNTLTKTHTPHTTHHTPHTASPSSYPPLTDAHVAKLKALTLASLAAGVPRGGLLPYTSIAAAVDVPPGRELDDLLIEGGLYTGLVVGRVDAAAAGVRVVRAAPRDVRRAHLPSIAAGLASWLDAALGVAASLEAAGRGALAAAVDGKAAAAASAAAVDAAAGGGGGAARATASDGDAPAVPGESPSGAQATPDAMDDDGGRPKRRR